MDLFPPNLALQLGSPVSLVGGRGDVVRLLEVPVSDHPAGGELASLLRGRRRHIGLSQQALADLSTVSVRAIRDLETGRTTCPRRETLELLADGLRMGPAQRAVLHAAVPAPLPPADAGTDQPETMMSLPVPPSAIVGRMHELAVLRDLVVADRERLVAIVGISGVGKSRLAIEFAREPHVRPYRDILWIPARSVEPDHKIPSNSQHTIALLRTCVMEMLGNESVDTRLISSLIGEDRVLLILDGYDGAVSVHSGIVNMLNSCPELQILMTTRNADNAIGWKVVPLSPLPIPVAGATDSHDVEAVQLLHRVLRHAGLQEPARSGSRDEGADQLATICSLVDGVPSTLELVGQWSTVYTLERLVTELTGDPQALASWPAATGKVYDTAGSLRRSLGRLDPSAHELLTAMADAAHPWSVTTAAEHTGRPEFEVARDVHSLLLHGHIRRVPTPRGPGFVVLRLARQVALAEERGDATGRRQVVPAAAPDWEEFVLDHCGPAAPPQDRVALGTATARRGAPTASGLV